MHEALVRDAMATLESLAEGKGITLEVDEHAAPKTLYCDQVKLTQVLVNLTGNAVKFTEEGGRVTLRVSSRESGYVRLSVQDTGIESRAKIFRRDLRKLSSSGWFSHTQASRHRSGLGYLEKDS